MMSINGHGFNGSFRARWWWNKRKRKPITDIENSKEREIETGEFEGENLGGDSRTEEWAPFPSGREAGGVIGVEVSEEVYLTSFRPPVHRYHSTLHFVRIELGFRAGNGIGSSFEMGDTLKFSNLGFWRETKWIYVLLAGFYVWIFVRLRFCNMILNLLMFGLLQ